MRALVALSNAIDRACRVGAAASLALMVLLIAIQVIARYVFSEPPGWTEEGARYAMVWSGLLGATVAFKAGADPVLVKLARLEGSAAISAQSFISACSGRARTSHAGSWRARHRAIPRPSACPWCGSRLRCRLRSSPS